MAKPDPHSVGRLWIEEGEAQTGLAAAVAPIAPIDKPYTYAVGPELADHLKVGQRVRVPMGKRGRLVPGFCVALGEEEWRHTLRPIHSLIDDESYLSPQLVDLGRWIARYYYCPLGPTLAALVPEAVRRKSGFATTRSARLTRPLDDILSGSVRIGPKSKALLETLAQAESPVEVNALLERAGTTAGTLRSAAKRGWVEVATERRPKPPPRCDVPRVEPSFELNESQETAIRRIGERIDAGGFSVTLLYGVSGSGKTEVYVRVMRRALARGGQVIMLVPEIALTTQLVNRLAARFDNVAVIHSGLTGVDRSLTWRAIARGELQEPASATIPRARRRNQTGPDRRYPHRAGLGHTFAGELAELHAAGALRAHQPPHPSPRFAHAGRGGCRYAFAVGPHGGDAGPVQRNETEGVRDVGSRPTGNHLD